MDQGTGSAPVDPAIQNHSNGGDDDLILDVRNLRTYYPVLGGVLRRRVGWVKAVDDVSFAIKRGETLGMVGESGCGKTTVGRSIIRLLKPQAGQVFFEGTDILKLPRDEMKRLRKDLQIIFQDPYGSLNPRMPVGDIIGEGLMVHGMKNRKEREEVVQYFLSVVGLRKEYVRRYPHEFSGGQRQRIGIARALALRPKFVVGDEPVSALDVSIQSQVLNLLKDLQQEFGLTYLFIAHDLSVVEYISDRVGVMYLGKLVELAEAQELYANPRMPYTQALLSAIPVPDPTIKKQRIVLQGDVPSPINPPSGCPFRTRCWLAQDICAAQTPPLREVEPNHWAACHFA
ncbi:MAG TPA: peptide ABC transporter substrate-binding protein [Chloroflexi bacterium]|nr:peptide ABC transporter substrate-binding protein [Chloroflexota bacterium]